VVASIYDGGDGRFSEDGQWWVVWPLDRLVDENRDAWDRGLPRDLLAFGDDGTGNPFCVQLATASADVLRWSWIDLAVERTEGSMDSFLAEWCGEGA
jgi:hypothetical protein